MPSNGTTRDPLRDELGALDWAWGDAYDIGLSGEKYYAWFLGDSGEGFMKDSPRELNAAIREDWVRRHTLKNA